MSKTVLLVGTRKGCFVLESDADRRDWKLRGPYCEGWPVYHAIYDPDSRRRSTPPPRASGTARRSGGAATSARRGTLSSEGLAYDDEAAARSRRSRRSPSAHGRAARRRRGAGHLREPRRRRDLVAALDARRRSRAARSWDDPANQPPGHLGISALMLDPDDADALLGDRAGRRPVRDDRRRRSRGRRATAGLRADWPREHEEVGFCVHKLVRSPVDGERMYQQNHVGMHRSDDAGQSWTEITEGLPTEFGFAAADAPARPRHVLRRSRSTRVTAGRCPTARRRSGARATPARAGSRSTTACRSATRTSACCARGWRSTRYDTPGLYFGTSTGPGVRERRRGRQLERDRELPAGDLVGRGRGRRLSHGRRPPPVDAARRSSRGCRAGSTSTRRPSATRSTQLDERWPGLRDRLCEPGPALRPHIHVYVDRRARGARHAARASARAST